MSSQETIFDHGITVEENRAFGLILNWEIDDDAAENYVTYSSDQKKIMDIALLYLYRLKLRTFMFYYNQIEDPNLLDEADEMIEEAFRYKFSK